MELLLNSFSTIVLLFLIVASCIIFTNAVEHLGKKLNLGDGAVGSIFAAVGTALPETIVPIVAIVGAYLAHTDVHAGKEIGIGAILGAPFLLSTLAMFMTGLAVLIFSRMKKRPKEMNVDSKLILRDLKFFIISYSVAILAGFTQNHLIKYAIVAFLFIYYGFYVYRTIVKSAQESVCDSEIAQLLYCKIFRQQNVTMFAIVVQVVFSLVCLVFFAHLFVDEIQYFAHVFKINPLILSLLIAPIATELPEKVNSVLWVGQGKDTLALGNITGAMIFQSCFPTSVGILLTPWVFAQESLVNILLVYAATLFLLVSVYFHRGKFCPVILTSCGIFYLIYIVYVAYDLIRLNS